MLSNRSLRAPILGRDALLLFISPLDHHHQKQKLTDLSMTVAESLICSHGLLLSGSLSRNVVHREDGGTQEGKAQHRKLRKFHTFAVVVG